ncbi:hypothetical protein G6F68_021306 [Rhizopus microsporus]|nr:hypothetical protein G6F68_021306 [Rhizopus microsporus]
MSAQRVISAATMSSVLAGVEIRGSNPSFCMRSFSAGDCNASASLAFRVSITGCGVPAGALTTNQVLNS